MDESLRVCLLGETVVMRDVTVVRLIGHRAALIAFLALRAPRSAARGEIVDALWGEQPTESAANAIQVAVSALRKALGQDTIESAGDGYRLAASVIVDVDEFARAATEGTNQLHRGAARLAEQTLSDALKLWRGPALAGLDADYARTEAVRLEELRLRVLETRVEAALAAGSHREIVAELEALVAQYPLREGLRAKLMQALYRCGRQAEALAVYDSGRRILLDELGLEPSPELVELQKRLLTQTEEGPRLTEIAVATTPRLPALLDETVGRDADVDALTNLVTDNGARLVTVMGPGGVGKTRLALMVGHRVTENFRDGAAVVYLAEAEAASDVAPTMCSALGLQAGDDAAVALEAALATRQMLLSCDNFEHVIDAAGLIPRLLEAAPGLHVLVTSRQWLGLRGEHRYVLEPLAASSSDVSMPPAVALFLTRARALDPGFEPSPQDLADVAAICEHCDGLPLALELAAARTRALSLRELRDHMADPVAFLDTGSRDLPPRHQTLRANIAWSVAALEADDMRFLTHLTVFRGGFTLPGASAVAGIDSNDALRRCETLLDRSLLRRVGAPDRSHRFGLLETIREYAAELLPASEQTVAQRRHATLYRDVLDQPQSPAPVPQRAADWRAMLAERANIRQGIRYALDGSDAELAGDLVVGASGMWQRLGPRPELADWLARLLSRPDLPAARRCDAYYLQASLADHVGDIDAMAAPLEEAKRLAESAGDDRRLAWVTELSAWGSAISGNPGEGALLLERATGLASAHPEDVQLQVTLLMTAGAIAYQSDVEQAARSATERALSLARTHELDVVHCRLLNNFCELQLADGLAEQARAVAEEGINLAGRVQDPEAEGNLLAQLGYARLLLGDPDGAQADLRIALLTHLQRGALRSAVDDLLRLAAACAEADPTRAAFLTGAFEAANPVAETSVHRQARERFLDDLPERLGDRCATILQQGHALVATHGAAQALSLILSDEDATDTQTEASGRSTIEDEKQD